MDRLYVNGMIAVKETKLLKDKIFRLCECSLADGFRLLSESGFGGANGETATEIEPLLIGEERALDEFILNYAPNRAVQEYLLTPRDFFNAKAVLKATYLKKSAEAMLSPAGLIPVEEIEKNVTEKTYSAFYEELSTALNSASAKLEEDASGAEIGIAFERALQKRLLKVCRRSRVLKGMLVQKADMTNILTAFRAGEKELAEKTYLEGGKLKSETLNLIFLSPERAERVLKDTPYSHFFALCLDARQANKPYTEAEKMLKSLETEFFKERRFEEDGMFLYYVFRRRSEIENVRTVFLCRMAGMDEAQIKARLKAM